MCEIKHHDPLMSTALSAPSQPPSTLSALSFMRSLQRNDIHRLCAEIYVLQSNPWHDLCFCMAPLNLEHLQQYMPRGSNSSNGMCAHVQPQSWHPDFPCQDDKQNHILWGFSKYGPFFGWFYRDTKRKPPTCMNGSESNFEKHPPGCGGQKWGNPKIQPWQVVTWTKTC